MDSSDMRNGIKLDMLLSKCCGVLRQIFRDRWFSIIGKEWIDSVQSGSELITHSDHIQLPGSEENLSLKQGNCTLWDITILSAVLLKFPKKVVENVDNTIFNENKNIKNLRKARNKLAHRPSKNMSNIDFEEHWNKIAQILISLGESNDDLDKLKHAKQEGGIEFKTNIHPKNEANIAKANALRERGNKAIKDNNFSKAIVLYTEAIVLPGLPDQDMAILSSNRSTASLRQFTLSNKNEDIYNALNDANKAKELWPGWWKAHYKIGKAYHMLNKLAEAIDAFDQALALEPTNEEVKNARYESRQKLGCQDRKEHLNPAYLDMNGEWNRIFSKSGIDTSGDEFKNHLKLAKRIVGKVDPILADVWKGHQYYDEKDYEMAAKFYGKAATKGSAEGMYNLAILTKLGKGVKQDFKLAINLLEQAASQPPKSDMGYNGFTVGVAEAEHLLGLSYEEGVGVQKNDAAAACWYKRAVEHGSPTAANNLGILYLKGHGVKKDLKKAEQHLKLAVSRNNVDAMVGLADLYLHMFDPEKALEWHHRAVENGNLYAKAREKEFLYSVNEFINLFGTSGVPEWEQEHNLSSDGLNYEERRERRIKTMMPQKSFGNLFENMKKLESLSVPRSMYEKKITSHKYDFNMLLDHANRGSLTAKKMIQAKVHFAKAMICLDKHDLNENLSSRVSNGICFVNELAACYCLEHIMANFTDVEKSTKSLEIVNFMLAHCASKGSKLSELNEANKNAQICFAVLHGSDLEPMIKFLSPCIQKYPNDMFFYEFRGSLNGFLKQYEETLRDANAGLQICPDHVGLLYSKAVAMKLLKQGANHEETINAYENFLSKAPNDHRKVPESYFSIALCYISLRNEKEPKKMDEMIKYYYEKGLAAEKIQLPCFLPYDSNTKTVVTALIETFNLLESRTSDTIINGPTATVETVSNETHSIEMDSTNRKIKLSDPLRIEIIKTFRTYRGFCLDAIEKNVTWKNTTIPPKKQKFPISLAGLKETFLRDIDFTKDHVLVGYLINLTIIDMPCTEGVSIQLVVEDDKQDIQRLSLYNFEQDKNPSMKHSFDIGCKITILNPYMRIATDHKPLLRIDDTSSVIMQPSTTKIINMCRCCGIGDAAKVCGRCRVARYCSEECQKLDWKTYCHKYICVPSDKVMKTNSSISNN